MEAVKKSKTVDDLMALPEDTRAELIDGEIVMMAPVSNAHNELQSRLNFIALGYAKSQKVSGDDFLRVLIKANTYHNASNTFMHDIAAFWNSEYSSSEKDPTKARPYWVCEVQSPSNWEKDSHTVLKVLESKEVPYYWVASPIMKGITVFKFDPSIKRYIQVIAVANYDGIVELEPFKGEKIDLSELFFDI